MQQKKGVSLMGYAEEGAPCLDVEAEHQCWNCHFTKILIFVDQFSANELVVCETDGSGV